MTTSKKRFNNKRAQVEVFNGERYVPYKEYKRALATNYNRAYYERKKGAEPQKSAPETEIARLTRERDEAQSLFEAEKGAADILARWEKHARTDRDMWRRVAFIFGATMIAQTLLAWLA